MYNSFSFDLSQNDTGSTRTGHITAKDADGNVVGTYTVTQTPLNPATITVLTNPSQGGTVTGGGTYTIGSQVQISASPARFFTFMGWNDGNITSPRTITVPSGGATYTANFSPTAVIIFYHEPENANGGIGHVFLQIISKEGNSETYGFCNSSIDVVHRHPGHLEPGFLPWDIAIKYPLNDAGYEAVAAAITYDIAHPPDYLISNHNGFDCVDWIAKIAAAAGIQLPGYTDRANISDPVAFAQSLNEIYASGGVSPDGKGVIIGGPSSSKLTAIPHLPANQEPLDYSYDELEIAGFANAASLSTSMGLAYDYVSLGIVSANSTNGISLSLSGVNPNSDIISMNWGDGSPFQEQSLSISHIYTTGTNAAQLLVIDSGAVHSYNMTVVVSSSAPTSININVTPFSPVSIPNQGLVPANSVPDFIVVRATSMTVLPNGHAVIGFIGVPTWTFTILTSSNLTQGFVPIGSAAAGTNGAFQFDDPGAVNANSRFYRASYP